MLGNSLRLRHLDKASANEAIRKPLDVYNKKYPADTPVTIEDGLVDELIKEVRAGKLSISQGGQGGVDDKSGKGDSEIRIEAPFLQLILTRLWEKEMSDGKRSLKLQMLNDLGGPAKIVQTHLDHAMKDLSTADQDIAANVFRYLVTPSGTKIAYTARDLAFYVKSEKLESVLDQLAGSVRILRKVTLPGEPTRYEIYHDVLDPAILDWRARYEHEKEDATQRAAQLKLQQDQTLIRWSVVGALAEIFFLFIPVGFLIVRFVLRRQEQSLSRKQIRSIYSTWLLASIISSVIFLVATGVIGYYALGSGNVSTPFMILFLLGFGPSMIGKLVAAPYFAFRKYQRIRKAEEAGDGATTGIASTAVTAN